MNIIKFFILKIDFNKMSQVVSTDSKDRRKHNFFLNGVATCTFIDVLQECRYKCSQDHHNGPCNKKCLNNHIHCPIINQGSVCGVLFKHEHCDKCGYAIVDNYHRLDCS